MIDSIKIMLGDRVSNFSDEQIGLALKRSLAEIEGYCHCQIDYELEMVACEIAVIKLNRMNSEGLSSQSYSGMSESYESGYPAHIQTILNRKRKIRVL
jgi:hypothetical protein